MQISKQLEMKIARAISYAEDWIKKFRIVKLEKKYFFARLSTQTVLMYDSDEYREWADPIIYKAVADRLGLVFDLFD